jgi:hypothetical protein
VEHDLEIPEHAFYLTLQLAFFSNVKERYDQVTQAVVDVGVSQSGEDSRPFPVLFGAKGMLGGLNQARVSRRSLN